MEEVSKMKVADLKRELKLRNLSTNGNKTELMERLQASLDGVENELLDESVLTDEDEAHILGDDDEILQSPKSLKININETKTDEDDLLLSPNSNTNTTTTTLPPKKVVLKRKNSFKDIEETISKENAQPQAVVAASAAAAATEQPKILKMSERNPITISNKDETTKTESSTTESKTGSVKLSQLSEKERLEMRAKKFGQVTAEATPQANAAKGAVAAAAAAATDLSSDQMEKLKKRAERFGVVSPTIAKLDESEKLLKRKERFGLEAGAAAATAATTTNTTATNDVWAEKKRQRLERFKTAEPVTVADKN